MYGNDYLKSPIDALTFRMKSDDSGPRLAGHGREFWESRPWLATVWSHGRESCWSHGRDWLLPRATAVGVPESRPWLCFSPPLLFRAPPNFAPFDSIALALSSINLPTSKMGLPCYFIYFMMERILLIRCKIIGLMLWVIDNLKLSREYYLENLNYNKAKYV